MYSLNSVKITPGFQNSTVNKIPNMLLSSTIHVLPITRSDIVTPRTHQPDLDNMMSTHSQSCHNQWYTSLILLFKTCLLFPLQLIQLEQFLFATIMPCICTCHTTHLCHAGWATIDLFSNFNCRFCLNCHLLFQKRNTMLAQYFLFKLC